MALTCPQQSFTGKQNIPEDTNKLSNSTTATKHHIAENGRGFAVCSKWDPAKWSADWTSQNSGQETCNTL